MLTPKPFSGNIQITSPSEPLNGVVSLPYSKSIANRLLLMQHLSHGALTFKPLSDAEDTIALKNCLYKSADVYHCGEGGTTLRFLLAALSLKPGIQFVHGSPRLSERPIKPLLEALAQCGLSFRYVDEPGKLPLEISGTAHVEKPMILRVPGNISSQFISALLMIAPMFKGGGQIQLTGSLISAPYVDMTIALMKKAGIEVRREGNSFVVSEGRYSGDFTTERDWSAASYAYSLCALSPGSSIFLPGLTLNSIQGDRICAEIAHNFGVSSTEVTGGIQIRQYGKVVQSFQYNFSDCPDLAQTFAFLSFAMGINCHFTGLKTLQVKETDRIAAIAHVVSQLGGMAFYGSDYLILRSSKNLGNPGLIPVFNDHRMAMSIAPLSLQITDLQIADAAVVNKSFPQFWEQLQILGFTIEQVT